MAETKKANFFQRTGKKIAKWFREMKSELKKVSWPSARQILNNTVVALTVMILVGVIVWLLDLGADKLTELLISIGG